ncbi:MAG TPA: Crp/Fnr family transcriptional regulator [Candidatus Dormibacteraeota bacterium]
MTVLTTAGATAATAWTRRRVREPEALWQELVAAAPVVEVDAACPVPADGLLNDAAAAVLDGVVRVFTVCSAGRQLTVRYCRPGDLFGLATALTGAGVPRAEAVTTVSLAVISTPSMRELALRDAQFAWSLAHEIAAASMDGVRTVAAQQQRSTLSQVAAHLLEWAAMTGKGQSVALVNHQQLADATGTAREVVTRALASLRELGVVETRRGAVVITDPPALTRVAERGEALSRSRG